MYEITIDKFYGYNRNLKNGYGEFYDTKNITSSYYPLLSTRHRRAEYSGLSVDALCPKSKFAFIRNNTLYYNGAATGLTGLNKGAKDIFTVCSMGAYLLIFPDKKYINTADLTDYGSIEALFTTGGTTNYKLCDIDGNVYSYVTEKPSEPADGEYWLDDKSLKQYSEYSETWISVLTTYIRIEHTKIGEAFNQYDGVTISGCIVSDINTTTVIHSKGDDYIVITGLIDSTVTQTTPITIKREMPDMDFFVEGENRVWGCSSTKNEVYACKLGDFKNWNCFQGLSTDSYAASVGTDGEFTGAVKYLSSILFFKENYIHKIYNTNPPYNISATRTKGVQKGSHMSICEVNGVLYYLSPTGVCRYEGITTPVQEVFGTTYYFNGVAGEFRNKYYICMSSGASTRELFVYDTTKGLWHKEDEINILQFASHNSNLYLIEKYRFSSGPLPVYDQKLRMIDGEQTYGHFVPVLGYFLEGDNISWSAETGLLGLDLSGNKYIKAVAVRYSLEPTDNNSGYIQLEVDYNSLGEWIVLDKVTEAAHKTLDEQLLTAHIPQRCDHLQLRISGVGQAKVYSITLSVEEGSKYG